MKLYTQKEEFELIQRIAQLSEKTVYFTAKGNNMSDEEFDYYFKILSQINILAEQLEKIHERLQKDRK